MSQHTEYIVDSDANLAGEQLDFLEALFDPPTIAFLEPVGIPSGWRCLDLGAGGGSISRWLAETVRPQGGVVAADIDTDRIVGQAGMRVIRHDANDGVPSGGPYDLIYARALLMHLKRREEIFSDLVEALAPGGWLVLAEASKRPQQVLTAPSAADEDMITRVITTALDACRDAGTSWEWAHQVDPSMAAAGLINIAGLEYCHTMTGGTLESQLSGSYVKQAEPRLLEAGITADELEQFYALLCDPRFRARPWIQMVFTRGQKPATRRISKSYVPNFLRDTDSRRAT